MDQKVDHPLAKYADRIRSFRSRITSKDELVSLRLYHDEKVTIHYAPFDWLNTSARVVIVGITPGADSMAAALYAAKEALRNGGTLIEASIAAKRGGIFYNMRDRIAEMLDDLGLHVALEIETCQLLFSDRSDLLHATSCIRYPTFRFDKRKKTNVNYSGTNPGLMSFQPFRPYIEMLAAELGTLPNALIVPCGERVAEALRLLLPQRNAIARVLYGFPHASGANAHFHRIWRANRDDMKRQVKEWASTKHDQPLRSPEG